MTAGRVPFDFASLAGPVARALLGDPNPRMSTARELRYGRKGSLVVRLDTGQWFDHESVDGGGVLALVARVQGCDRAAAARWIELQGFGERVSTRESDSDSLSGMTTRGGASRPRISTRPGTGQVSRRDSARRLWESTLPIAGTVAAAYLDARGVGFVAGARSLRFHPRITHPNAPGCFPALVAGVQDVDGQFLGIQRTYLNGPRKAAAEPVHASLGSLAGGAVRLGEWVARPLLIGEGIESTAAAMRMFDWHDGAWATLGTSGLRAVALPDGVCDVVIAADRDLNGAGQLAAAALAERLEAEGRCVAIHLPERFGDFNDELTGMVP